ncbi:pentatricopeptide repeat-containing protein [Panicum miliaceum]|uniref:Pentatricopeptide repeat-containing protein n=1 Tax=Panicum miliaceum TaxID=4540 RepID=A0A3L6S5T4_PANMI|nr:pentatricopeptide repeat-containing protein [Panicum miliaceum]
MAVKPIPTAAAAAPLHGDQQVAAALLAAAGALRGGGDAVPVPGALPPRPHRRLHLPHCPLPPLLPHPSPPPRLPAPVPPPHLTSGSSGAGRHRGAGVFPLPSCAIPQLSARSGSLSGPPLLTPPGCWAADARLGFPAARWGSTSAASDDADDDEGGSSEQEAASCPEHVGRVCAAIADVVATGADANLVAALSALSPPLSEALLLAVLDRFKHAHRPSHRFFRWATAAGGFVHTTITYCKMAKARQFESMVALVQEMGKAGALSMDAFKIAIKSFAAAGEIKNAVGVFELMRKNGFDDGVESFNCLLVALAQEGLGREARQVFDRMQDRYTPDLRSYTALMLAWCNARNLVEAERVWNEMLEKGMKPDVVVHNAMIDGLLRGQRRPEAVKMFELMKAKRHPPNVRTYTMLIRDHCKRGEMDIVRCGALRRCRRPDANQMLLPIHACLLDMGMQSAWTE